MFVISQPLPPGKAVNLPLPQSIHRLSPIEESRIRTILLNLLQFLHQKLIKLD